MAKFCGECGSKLQPKAKFCGQCGTKVLELRTCPKCRLSNPPESSWCDCGYKFSEEGDPKKFTHREQQSTQVGCLICARTLRLQEPAPGRVFKCPSCASEFHVERDMTGAVHLILTFVKSDLAACYEVLGVQPGVGEEALRDAYGKKVVQYHPDKLVGLGKELCELAEEKTKQINLAYERIVAERRMADA